MGKLNTWSMQFKCIKKLQKGYHGYSSIKEIYLGLNFKRDNLDFELYS